MNYRGVGMTTTLYSLPLDQTNLYIHMVEVQVQYSGEEPEPDCYDPDYEEGEEDPWFIRGYCYVVPDYQDPDLYTYIRSCVEEDNTEGWDITDIQIEDIYTDPVSEYPTNCRCMDKDLDLIWKEEFIRRWGNPEEDNIFVFQDRLYVPDPSFVLFPGVLSYTLEEQPQTDQQLLDLFQEEEVVGLQIHKETNYESITKTSK